MYTTTFNSFTRLPRLVIGGLALSLLLFGTLTLGARTARAQSEAVLTLYRTGYELMQQQEYERALAIFEQIRQLDESPRVFAQIGLAEAALGRWIQAEAHLRQALAETEDEYIRDRRADLQQRYDRILDNLGSIELSGGVEESEVYVDGELRGMLPTPPIYVLLGDRRIEVRTEGAPFSIEVHVSSGEVVRLEVPRPVPQVLEEEATEGQATEGQATEGQATEEEGAEPSPEPSSGGMWTPGWVIGGVGAASVLVGAILGGLSLSIESELAAQCANDGDGDDRACAPSVYDESFRTRQSEGQAFADAADALIFGGLGVTAVGVILAFVLAEPEGEDERPDVALACGPAGCSASLELSF